MQDIVVPDGCLLVKYDLDMQAVDGMKWDPKTFKSMGFIVAALQMAIEEAKIQRGLQIQQAQIAEMQAQMNVQHALKNGGGILRG